MVGQAKSLPPSSILGTRRPLSLRKASSAISLLLLCGISLLFLAGCAGSGVSPFQPIDLSRDLDDSALARYKSAAEKSFASNPSGHMVTLEKTDWRIPGLLAYWKKGKVEAMHGAGGEWSYMVSKTQGWGPLALIYVSEKQAMYSPSGQLEGTMGVESSVWGHLSMRHSMRWKSRDSSWQEHWTLHLIHHLVSISDTHGRKSVSFFSAPNPLSFGE